MMKSGGRVGGCFRDSWVWDRQPGKHRGGEVLSIGGNDKRQLKRGQKELGETVGSWGSLGGE